MASLRRLSGALMAGRQESRVAVVITTYNHAHFLAAAIESVLAQTIRPSEIVVIDDGSSDHPEQVTTRYSDIRIVRQPNAGLAAARNRGLRETSAPFVLFLDADDQLRPAAIESGLASLSKDGSAAFTYGAHAIVQAASGKVIEIPFRPVPKSAFADLLRHNPVKMHGTVIYRRGAIEAAGGFREHLPAVEDYDLYLRLAREHPVVCHPEICADYWHHGGNMSGNPAFMLKTVLSVLDDQREEADRRGLLADYEAGVRGWKLYYTSWWLGMLRRSPRTAVGPGLSLLRKAPGAMLRSAAARLAGRRDG
jgi:glycosyltransferase involved in cell wall biosynthesis